MRDITLGDTFYHQFTTRAFASGVPTQLAGSPVLKVLEENNATPITSGVSVSVDRATVTGLNEATIVATSGNGYEAGKSYAIYISTGTVGGVSVVGEVVGHFTVQASAAYVSLSALFTGITSLAQWLGLIAGKQAGNATALTEIKATGAGSGTYDPTTDSLEANRDNIGTNGAALSFVSADVKKINGTAIVGDGSGTPFNV